MTRMRAGGLIVALLLASACNEPQPNLAERRVDTLPQHPDTLVAAPGSKACSVVTTEELEQIVKIDLKPGRTTNDYMGVSQCQWDPEDGYQGGVSVTVRMQGDMNVYKSVPGSVAVSGIGDEATWSESLNQLAVRVGERVMSVSLLSKPANRAQAEQIARVAVRRLGGERA